MAISTIGQNGLNAPLSLTSPALTTPNLGTPSALVLTNATALPSVALPTGSVLQVVQYVFAPSSYTTFSGFTVNTQLNGAITPKFATSKILVTMTYTVGTSTTANAMCTAQLMRNGSQIFYIGQIAGNVVSTRALQNVVHNYLDSPASTSAQTYRLQVNSVDGATCYIGAWGYAPNDWQTSCILTLTEIAG